MAPFHRILNRGWSCRIRPVGLLVTISLLYVSYYIVCVYNYSAITRTTSNPTMNDLHLRTNDVTIEQTQNSNEETPTKKKHASKNRRDQTRRKEKKNRKTKRNEMAGTTTSTQKIDIQANPKSEILPNSQGSETATVMGIATRYTLNVYQSFVGSLRKTGYKGHIILGVSSNIEGSREEQYLLTRNVTLKKMSFVPCTHQQDLRQEGCMSPYQNIKLRWSRYPLARDWLLECTTCTGPVLITDVRDTFFQVDPFYDFASAKEPYQVDGLQVFEENPTQWTDHWIVDVPIRQCREKEIQLVTQKPMLCSGTTIGTREAMLFYLDKMYHEMKLWMDDPKCMNTGVNGDDQAIHNYLYYTGRLAPYVKSIPPRTGIVNTVGVDGSKILDAHREFWEKVKGKSRGESNQIPFMGATDKTWIGKIDFLSYNLTDDNGSFINTDGTRSRVIHQYDRFGYQFEGWIEKQDIFQDHL